MLKIKNFIYPSLFTILITCNCSGIPNRNTIENSNPNNKRVNEINIGEKLDSIAKTSEIPSNNQQSDWMEIQINEGSIIIRTKYTNEKDIVYKYVYNNTKIANGNFIGKSVYIIPKTIKLNGNLDQYLAHDIDDSISALGTEQYWFILGQHGYFIPKVTLDNPNFKIGQKVINENNDEFEIIDILKNEIYLSPKIVVNEKKIDRKWKSGTNFKFLKNENGDNSSKILKVSGYQIRPMMKKNSQKILIDGEEIKTKGTFKGQNIELVDDFDCINPVGATFNNKDEMEGKSLLNIKQSYFFKGTSTYLSTTLHMYDWLPFIKYHGIQPVGLRRNNDKKVYFIFPKVKPQQAIKNSKAVDWNYPTDVSIESVSTYSKYLFKANLTDLKNLQELPDRVIQFQKSPSSNQFGIGFAAGLDLENGFTAKGRREKYSNEAFALSGNLSNKVYFRTLTSSQFKDGILPKDFKATFNGYYSYYIPENGIQTYVVNTKNSSYIYINTQEKFVNKIIRLEDYLDNKNITIVENNGITISQNTIKNGEINFSTKSKTPSYIVLKVQL